jgi:hypothetical protein
MRPRFVIVNAALIALVIAGFAVGMFAALPSLGMAEKIMLGMLGCLTLFGLALGFAGRWDDAAHIALVLPMLGLVFTGLGLLNAVFGLGALTPDALAVVFRQLGFAIAPNVVGVLGMGWITIVGWWAARVQV